MARIRNSQSKPPVRVCQTGQHSAASRSGSGGHATHYRQRLVTEKAEFMQNAVAPRATRKVDSKCLIIVHKTIHKFLVVSNVYCERFKHFCRQFLTATNCKQRTNVYCNRRTCENRGRTNFLFVGIAGSFSTKISTDKFPLKLAITYGSREASKVEGCSFSRRDSGTLAFTNTRSAS